METPRSLASTVVKKGTSLATAQSLKRMATMEGTTTTTMPTMATTTTTTTTTTRATTEPQAGLLPKMENHSPRQSMAKNGFIAQSAFETRATGMIPTRQMVTSWLSFANRRTFEKKKENTPNGQILEVPATTMALNQQVGVMGSSWFGSDE